MATFAIRQAHTKQLLNDPDNNLSSKEAYLYLFNQISFEVAHVAYSLSAMVCGHFARKLNRDIEIYKLRKSIKDL